MIINREMLPTEDIIPITFMSGSGGNFLCHFIVSAKRNIHDIIELSTHGNAHAFSLKDLDTFSKGINWPDKDKIDFLLSQSPDTTIKKPYYVSCHIKDVNLIKNTFKKSIRIVYDLDDLEEITTVFYGKWAIDDSQKIRPIYKKEFYMRDIRKQHQNFNKIADMDGILFISWKELFKENIEEFISKLSIFTGIDKDNFSRESLMHWRNKTQFCINTFNKIE